MIRIVVIIMVMMMMMTMMVMMMMILPPHLGLAPPPRAPLLVPHPSTPPLLQHIWQAHSPRCLHSAHLHIKSSLSFCSDIQTVYLQHHQLRKGLHTLLITLSTDLSPNRSPACIWVGCIEVLDVFLP